MTRPFHTLVSIVLFIFCLMPLVSSAQGDEEERLRKFMRNSTPEQRANLQTDQMKEFLKLSDEQAEKVSEINLKYANEVQEIYESKKSRSKKRQELRDMIDRKDIELKAVLTGEQYKTYQAGKVEMRKRFKGRRR